MGEKLQAIYDKLVADTAMVTRLLDEALDEKKNHYSADQCQRLAKAKWVLLDVRDAFTEAFIDINTGEVKGGETTG